MALTEEEFLERLEKDRKFRMAVAGLLGYREIMEKMEEHDRKFNEILEELREHRRILDEHTKRLEEHDRKFNEILEELREHRRILDEHTKRLEEHDRKFNEILEELREHRRILDEHTKRLEEHDRKFKAIELRLEAHDRKFNEILEEIRNIKVSQAEMSERIETLSRTYYSISSTLGDLVEDWLLTKFEEELRREGLDLKEIRRITVNGREIDAVLRDDEAVVVEVSSTVKVADVLKVDEEAELVSKILRRRVRKVILGMKADKKALDLARKKGVEIKVRLGSPMPL